MCKNLSFKCVNYYYYFFRAAPTALGQGLNPIICSDMSRFSQILNPLHHSWNS